MKALILILTLLALTACGPAEEKTKARELTPEEIALFVDRFESAKPAILERLKAELPGIEADDVLTQSVRVRNLIHHRTDIYNTNFGDWNEPLENFFGTLDRTHGQLCAGMSFAWQVGMYALGVPTRYVGLAVGSYAVLTHAEAELFLDGRWVAVDTTYNNMYVDSSGRFLSFAEMREMSIRGEEFFVEMNGQTSVSDYLNPTIQDIGMKNYLNLVAIFPGPGELQDTYLPETYNGWLDVPGQGLNHVTSKNNFYDFLKRAYEREN